MSRSNTVIKTGLDANAFENAVASVLVKSGFSPYYVKNERLWKKGNGWITAPQFFKVSLNGDSVIIEGWIKTALLPFVFIGESSLESMYGFAVKAFQRDVLRALVSAVILPGTVHEGYYPR